VACGSRLLEKQTVPHWIAGSRMQIAQARLLVLHAAWTMDTLGRKRRSRSLR